jgi:hypothetical protein
MQTNIQPADDESGGAAAVAEAAAGGAAGIVALVAAAGSGVAARTAVEADSGPDTLAEAAKGAAAVRASDAVSRIAFDVVAVDTKDEQIGAA